MKLNILIEIVEEEFGEVELQDRILEIPNYRPQIEEHIEKEIKKEMRLFC